MQIIIMGQHHGQARTLVINWAGWVGLAGLVLPLLLLVGWCGAQWQSPMLVSPVVVTASNTDQVRVLVTQSQLDALTLRVGELQARLMRLDAVGQRLVSVAGLDSGEFDFSQQPALGGPEPLSKVLPFGVSDLDGILSRLDGKMSNREGQFGLLGDLLAGRDLADDTFVAGLPVNSGYLSSPFGFRSDPFSGARSLHAGVDYSGPAGSDIISVAAGVVLQAESVNGYGELVAIDHGNGLISRYAHCKQVHVRPGERVQKGQVIATLGRSGRATGNHLHFEILKDGEPQNPEHYIHRTSR